MKICSLCKRILPASEFYTDKTKADGLQSRCKDCTKRSSRRWEADNPEKKKMHQEKYREKCQAKRPPKEPKSKLKAKKPEKPRKVQGTYESPAEYKKLWRQQNRHKEALYRSRNQERRREYIREYSRKFRADEQGRLKKRIYTRNRRSRLKGADGQFTVQEWEALKTKFGFTCLKCKRSEPEILLTPDHIVPISKGGSNDISNIQPLCLKCNTSKGAKTIDFR